MVLALLSDAGVCGMNYCVREGLICVFRQEPASDRPSHVSEDMRDTWVIRLYLERHNREDGFTFLQQSREGGEDGAAGLRRVQKDGVYPEDQVAKIMRVYSDEPKDTI